MSQLETNMSGSNYDEQYSQSGWFHYQEICMVFKMLSSLSDVITDFTISGSIYVKNDKD